MIDFVLRARPRRDRRRPSRHSGDRVKRLCVGVAGAADDIEHAAGIARQQLRRQRDHIVDEQELAQLLAVAPERNRRIGKRPGEKPGRAVIVRRLSRSVDKRRTKNEQRGAVLSGHPQQQALGRELADPVKRRRLHRA